MSRQSQYGAEKAIHEPANLHFGDASIQCIKSAEGKCKSTKPVEKELEEEEKDEKDEKFDPTAPQYHGSLDFVEKVLPLDYVKKVVPV